MPLLHRKLLYDLLWTKAPPFFFEKYLTVQTDSGDENKPLWTIFNNRLQELKGQGFVGTLVNPQPSPGDTIDLPATLGREGDILRAVIELLHWILPRRGQSIRLQTMGNQTKGKGLSMSIVRESDRKLLAERVFWAQQFHLDEATHTVEEILMTPVILWLYDWQRAQGSFLTWLSGKLGLPDDHKKKPGKDKDWEIKAYCILAGSFWSTDRELGKKLYWDVLRRDPDNRRAQLGLGRIFIEDSHQKGISVYERKKRLQLAIDYLEEVRADSSQPDELWIAAEYNLAVARLYLEESGEAKKDCNQLLSKLIPIPDLGSSDKSGTSRIRQNLKAMNRSFQNLLRQKSKHRKNQPEADDLKKLLNIYKDAPEFWTNFKTMSLILNHIVMLRDEPPQNEHDLEKKIKKAIDELAQQINSRFDPNRLLLINLHYRSQYNVACYFSRCYLLAKTNKWANKNQYADLVLDYLRLALAHNGGLMMLAQEDPALEPIRKDHKKKFDSIVGATEADEEVEEDQNLTRVVVEGPIVLTSEDTQLQFPNAGLGTRIVAPKRQITSRT